MKFRIYVPQRIPIRSPHRNPIKLQQLILIRLLFVSDRSKIITGDSPFRNFHLNTFLVRFVSHRSEKVEPDSLQVGEAEGNSSVLLIHTQVMGYLWDFEFVQFLHREQRPTVVSPHCRWQYFSLPNVRQVKQAVDGITLAP